MPDCYICSASFEQPRNCEKLTCSPRCAALRKQELKRLNRVPACNAYGLMGLTAEEACQTLEPVSRREFQSIMENFFNMVLTPAEEVELVFAEASLLGRGAQCRKGTV